MGISVPVVAGSWSWAGANKGCCLAVPDDMGAPTTERKGVPQWQHWTSIIIYKPFHKICPRWLRSARNKEWMWSRVAGMMMCHQRARRIGTLPPATYQPIDDAMECAVPINETMCIELILHAPGADKVSVIRIQTKSRQLAWPEETNNAVLRAFVGISQGM
jgi:hypothetical protein